MAYATPGGKERLTRCITARTFCDSASALLPGAWKIRDRAASLLLSRL